ncbi:MAG: DNA polymerase III subunit beta [Candidatus Colwellbacteria bacterium]|nr:DNA polymerase III subunit beta [Candidatus Colwellbacteria bacterium]
MKLIVLRDNLKVGLDTVSRAVGGNANLPVLGNVLLKTTSNQIRLSATNLELAITKTVPGKVIEDGSVTVPFGILSSIINNIASERVNLEVKDTNLTLQTDNYNALIQGTAESDFPIIPKVKKDKEALDVNGSVFRDALEKVVIAAGISEIRPEISGVLLTAEQSVLKLTATDSFRLAEMKLSGAQFKNTFEQGFKVIIPLRTAQELVRVTKENQLKIYLDQNQVLFETDETEAVSRLIEGNFPDYEPIIPKTLETEVIVDRGELTNSLKLASAFSGKVSEVKLRVKDKKVLEVYSSDHALGENSYLIPVKVKGTEAEVVFNWRFLLDGIKSGSSKEVFVGLNGDSKPALIKSPEETSYFYILMPVKG